MPASRRPAATLTRSLIAAALTLTALLTGAGCAGTPADSTAPAPAVSPTESASDGATERTPGLEPDPAGVVDTNPTYAAPRVAPLDRDNVFGLPAATATRVHREYGPWLLDMAFRPDAINTKAAKLPPATFAAAAAKMTPPVAAEWWDNVERRASTKAQSNLMALMYFGYANQPDVKGPRVVNVRVSDARLERNRIGTLRYSATVYGELRSTKRGKPVRWPYENKVDLTLAQWEGAWKVATWSGAYRYLEVIWER